MDYNFNDLTLEGIDLSSIEVTDEDIELALKKLDSLFGEIEENKTPVIRKTPQMLDKITNYVEREKELVEFTRLHNIYIKPLSEFAKGVCIRTGTPYSEIPSFSSLSIIGRISKLCDFLIGKGVSIDTIKQLFSEQSTEVEELLEEKKNITAAIVRKTPDAIKNNSNPIARENELAEFSLLHDLYVEPLAEFSKRVCTKLKLSYSEIPNLDQLSIMGRMAKLCDFLVDKGCTMDIIKQLLPKKESEIRLLANVKKIGFDMGYGDISDLTNKNRIERAKNYLLSNTTSNYNDTETKSNEKNR